jgi:hypothetical protein
MENEFEGNYLYEIEIHMSSYLINNIYNKFDKSPKYIVERCAIIEDNYKEFANQTKSIVEWVNDFDNVLPEDKQFIRDCYGS